jgi:hypothetical protein
VRDTEPGRHQDSRHGPEQPRDGARAVAHRPGCGTTRSCPAPGRARLRGGLSP